MSEQEKKEGHEPWYTVSVTGDLRARAEKAEAERDALRAEVERLRDTLERSRAQVANAVELAEAKHARVRALEGGIMAALVQEGLDTWPATLRAALASAPPAKPSTLKLALDRFYSYTFTGDASGISVPNHVWDELSKAYLAESAKPSLLDEALAAWRGLSEEQRDWCITGRVPMGADPEDAMRARAVVEALLRAAAEMKP